MLSIIVLGRSGTGKTSLISRYVDEAFSQEQAPQQTVSMTFSTKDITHKGEEYTLQIWDTAGSDIYLKQMSSKATINTFWKNVSGFLIVAEDSNCESLAIAERWIMIISEHVRTPNGKAVPYFLVINKSHESDVLLKKEFSTVSLANVQRKISRITDSSDSPAEDFDFKLKNLLEAHAIS
jgi:small GTP-binding protein